MLDTTLTTITDDEPSLHECSFEWCTSRGHLRYDHVHESEAIPLGGRQNGVGSSGYVAAIIEEDELEGCYRKGPGRILLESSYAKFSPAEARALASTLLQLANLMDPFQ